MDKKLSILFLCGWYPSRVSPFNGDFVERHAKAVAKRHIVNVIHIISDKNLKNNIEFVSKEKGNLKTHIAYLKLSKNPIKKGFNYIKAFFLIRKKIGHIDITHLNEVYPFGLFSLYLKWFSKKKYIISEHWTGYHKPQNKKINFLQKKISKLITKNASYVCPVSDDLGNSMQLFGLEGNYKKVPNVVDTTLFFPASKAENIFTITHISNMNNQHKNIKGLLNVVLELQKEITNFEFQFIGEGSYKYKDYAKNLGINLKTIQFIDQIPHLEIAEKLKNSNVFILFSNYENLPCVILESFSCGVPVISTNTGGINEYFPDNFGKLINVKDEKKLKTEILNFYNNQYKVAKKEKMHNYVKSYFSEEAIVKEFSNLYYKTLNL